MFSRVQRTFRSNFYNLCLLVPAPRNVPALVKVASTYVCRYAFLQTEVDYVFRTGIRFFKNEPTYRKPPNTLAVWSSISSTPMRRNFRLFQNQIVRKKMSKSQSFLAQHETIQRRQIFHFCRTDHGDIAPAKRRSRQQIGLFRQILVHFYQMAVEFGANLNLPPVFEKYVAESG